mmetsp:Transcript_40273/g.110834  ORF Transcript_40273/g.110834 Transcript_40273/m.110834 type:complete len:298 (-) Transcript_40273:835-1728(-)
MARPALCGLTSCENARLVRPPHTKLMLPPPVVGNGWRPGEGSAPRGGSEFAATDAGVGVWALRSNADTRARTGPAGPTSWLPTWDSWPLLPPYDGSAAGTDWGAAKAQGRGDGGRCDAVTTAVAKAGGFTRAPLALGDGEMPPPTLACDSDGTRRADMNPPEDVGVPAPPTFWPGGAPGVPAPPDSVTVGNEAMEFVDAAIDVAIAAAGSVDVCERRTSGLGCVGAAAVATLTVMPAPGRRPAESMRVGEVREVPSEDVRWATCDTRLGGAAADPAIPASWNSNERIRASLRERSSW